jgi:UDP-2,3-diacylglucosamine hydrolase
MKNSAYFIADAHLGITIKADLQREELLIRFLGSIGDTASHLFILGDLFDFWIEYNRAIRPDYFMILHELKLLIDKGVSVYYVAGNHDFALGPFMQKTLGIIVAMDAIDITLQEKKLHLCHGDGVIPSETGYRFWRSVLRNPLNQRLYKMLHPSLGIGIAGIFSKTSRRLNDNKYTESRRREYVNVAAGLLQKGTDIVLMAHTHYPEIHTLEGKIYCNIGDWMKNFTYGILENGAFSLLKYRPGQSPLRLEPFTAK